MSEARKLDFKNVRLRVADDEPVQSSVEDIFTSLRESRENTRYPVAITVLFNVGYIDHMFTSENISVGGMKLNAALDTELFDITEPLRLKIVASTATKEFKFFVTGFLHSRDYSVVVFDKESKGIISLFIEALQE